MANQNAKILTAEQEAKLLTTYHWAIVWRETGVVIGDISVPTADMRSQWAEVGYCLSRAFWGRGIMTEALSAVIDFLIGKVGFLRIEAKHATENVASGRVMEKCGFYGKEKEHAAFSYQIEYILEGDGNDLDNLRAVANKILLILSLIHI